MSWTQQTWILLQTRDFHGNNFFTTGNEIHTNFKSRQENLAGLHIKTSKYIKAFPFFVGKNGLI
jgi:hypothetical protein